MSVIVVFLRPLGLRLGYHIIFDPPKSAGKCDECGNELYQRDDDSEETMAKRLSVYDELTAPLVSYYDNENLLRRIQGMGSIDEIQSAILGVLEGGCR